MILAGQGYEAVRELGGGALGRVVLATHYGDRHPGRHQVPFRQLRRDSDFLRDFRAEARLLAEVDSPACRRL